MILAVGICAAVWLPPSQSAAEDPPYPMTFPWRGDSLDPDVYFRTRGHTAQDYGNSSWGIDFHAAKRIGTQWQEEEGGSENEDTFIYGVPLYSPVDGEIIACWRSAPDKPGPGIDYDLDGDLVFGEGGNCSISDEIVCEENADCPASETCAPGHDSSPLGGGNHVQIRDSSGDFVILLAHMQEFSIPPEICPLPADRDEWDTVSEPGWLLPGADGWPDDDSYECDIDDRDGVMVGTVLPTPVPVEAGDFLGRVGHSGRSTNPHLHMQVKPLETDGQGDYCEDKTVEMVFYESWSQKCASGAPLSGGWSPLDSGNPLEPYDLLNVTCDENSDCAFAINAECSRNECVIAKPAYCFLPDAIGIQEDHDPFAFNATNLHFTTHDDGDVLVYQSSDDLRLRSYDVSNSGTIISQSTRNEGAVLDVAAARPFDDVRDVVVSIRGNTGYLKHIPYSVSANGTITRKTGHELSENLLVSQVETTPSPVHAGFVAAVEDNNGNLKVYDYLVEADYDVIKKAGTGSGGAIDDVAITTMDEFDGVVTAEITSSAYLVLRSFSVPGTGGVTLVETQLTIVQGSSVTIDRVPPGVYAGAEYVVTSVIQNDETLRVDSWRVEAGGLISWVDSATTGIVGEHDGTGGSTIVGDFVVGVRDSAEEFRLIGWDVDWLGQLRRNSTRDELGAATDLAIVGSQAGGGNHLVAARTDGGGNLHLYVYGENYNGWF